MIRILNIIGMNAVSRIKESYWYIARDDANDGPLSAVSEIRVCIILKLIINNPIEKSKFSIKNRYSDRVFFITPSPSIILYHKQNDIKSIFRK